MTFQYNWQLIKVDHINHGLVIIIYKSIGGLISILCLLFFVSFLQEYIQNFLTGIITNQNTQYELDPDLMVLNKTNYMFAIKILG